MPHIVVKMLKGRDDEQKTKVSTAVANALLKEVGCDICHISVAIEDFTAEEWQEVYKNEIDGKDNIYLKSNYDPKTLLKK